MTTEFKNLTIKKFEHDTVVITSEEPKLTIVFDPFQAQGSFRGASRADVVFITHDHFDHFSPKDIQSLASKETYFVFPASILDKVQTFLDVNPERLIPVVPLEEYKIQTKTIQLSAMAVPAYNIDKKSPQGNLYHPKEKEFVGFVVDINGVGVYFVGDSDPIPEMEALAGMVDVLLIPISGVYVMNIPEAVEVTKMLSPKLVIPMHYGAVVGEMGMGEQFRQVISEADFEIKVEV
jgi:L-ascorbate metabolism protein UlaG (beta-lactamase superfamily)